MADKTITILVPVFNEARNLPVLVEQLDRVTAECAGIRFDYLFVDDGSTDGSVEQLERLAAANPRVRVLELSRNFGKEVALSAGIDRVDADALVIMDADLQHPPACIPKLVRTWEQGYEIVASKRVRSEKQPLLRRYGSLLFYRLLNAISEFKMEPGTTDFRIIDRVVVDALRQFHERNRMVRGLIDWMGFRRTSIDFVAPERHAGAAGYTYPRLFALAMNSFMAFSLVPLKVAGYVGLFTIIVFGALLATMLIDRAWMNVFNFSSLAFVVVINVIMNGIVLGCLGLVALYVGHIHTETIGRPLYLVRRAVGFDGPKA